MLADSIVVDARVVNDVKVNEEGTLAVITRENASSRRNGIVIASRVVPGWSNATRRSSPGCSRT